MERKDHLKTYACIAFAMLMFNVSKACDSTAIIAHRGASGLAPENTLSAFQLAIDIGSDYLELDVRMSSDDSLMVIHDATVDATTDGTGTVSSKTYAQLRALDAGSWFGPAFIGEQIPTLREALSMAKNNGSKVCVEMKQTGIRTAVLNLIQDLNMIDDVIIFSFDLTELQMIKMTLPAVKVCFLDNSISQTEITNLNGINGEYVGCGDIPTIDDVEFARNLNVDFFAWTVNDPDDMQKLMSKGVAGIITDDPQEAKGLKTYMGIGNGGLMAYWDFDEGWGSSLYDSSGNGNDASTSGVSWSAGHSGFAGVFNGTTSFAAIPLSPSLDISGAAVSISAWLNLDVLPGALPGTFGPVFDSDEDAYILYLDQATSELRFKVKDNDGDAEKPGIPGSLLTTGDWFHVAGVYNGDEAMIYLNGVLVDYHVNTALDNLQTGQVPQFGQNGGFYFDGRIDEFKVFNRALSRDEVEQLHQSQALNCSVMANEVVELTSLGLYEDQDTTFCDSAQLDYSIADLPRISFEFDGVVDYVNLNGVVPDLSGNSHSFFGWFKTSNPTADERIFSINGPPSSNSNVCLFGIYNGLVDVYNGSYYSGSTLVNDGNWHFLGYSWDQATQQLQLWVDGVLDGNFTTDLTVSSTDLGSLGQEFDGLEVSNMYNGSMAELTVWKIPLSGPEITQLMLSPVATSDSNYSELVGYYNAISGCPWELKDRSGYANHGISCVILGHDHVVIPSFNNSDLTLSWSSDVLGTLSTSNSMSFMANESQVLVFAADNGYGTVYTDTTYITVNNCSGIASEDVESLSIYPNPTRDVVHISVETGRKGMIEVRSIQGETLKNTAVLSGTTTFDLTDLSNGVYIIIWKTEKSTCVNKLVKSSQ